MKLPKHLFEAAKTVPPDHLALYLSNRGWRRLEHEYFGTTQWVHLKSGLDVLLPKDQRVRDYGRLAADILRTLEGVEQRPASAILVELQRAGADVLRVRRPTEDPHDTIPLAAGRALVEAAVRMLSAAATSAIERRPVLPRRRPRQALDYVDRRVRMGHSERGSYVVTIISDVAPLNTPGGMPGLLELMDTPFPRLVTRTLSRALTVSTESAEAIADGRTDVLEEAVSKGISAEFFESLGGLVSGAPDREGLGIGIDWAPALPEKRAGPMEVWFERTAQELFLSAAQAIRETAPIESVAIMGLVEGLNREEGRTDGMVTVACFIDMVPRKLHVPLQGAEYEAAISAHRDNRIVVFRADVERRGNRYYADNVKGFRTTDD